MCAGGGGGVGVVVVVCAGGGGGVGGKGPYQRTVYGPTRLRILDPVSDLNT